MRLTPAQLLTGLVALWGGFWLLPVFLPRYLVFDIVNAVLTAGSAGALVAYLPSIRDMLRNRAVSTGHLLGIGICIIAGSMGIARTVYNWIWRYHGQPHEMINHPLLAWIFWIAVTGYLLHLTAQGVIEGEVPTRNWIVAGLWTALGVAVGFAMVIWYEPSPYFRP